MFLDLLKTLLTLRVPLLCYTLPTTLQRTQTGGPPDTGHRWLGFPVPGDCPRSCSLKLRPRGGRLGGPTPASGLTQHSHWMYHARQMALLSRILSLHCSFRPLKFFHFGDTSFPLKGKKKKKGETQQLL